MDTSLKEKILILRNEGKSYNEISKILGCSKATISHHCMRNNANDIGLSKRKLTEKEIDEIKEYYKTHTKKETAIYFNISEPTVTRYKDYKRILLTEEERIKKNYLGVKSFRVRIKERAVEYKGGKCVICDYNRCIKGFDFHHLDPAKKDFTIGTNTSISWKKVKNEIEKCVLVCCRCHREIHDGLHKDNPALKTSYQ